MGGERKRSRCRREKGGEGRFTRKEGGRRGGRGKDGDGEERGGGKVGRIVTMEVKEKYRWREELEGEEKIHGYRRDFRGRGRGGR